MMDTIINPTKIIAIGLNYSDHAKELKMDIPDFPLIFMKPSTTCYRKRRRNYSSASDKRTQL